MRFILALSFVIICYQTAFADYFDVGPFGPTTGDINAGKNSFICQDVDQTPSTPTANMLKFYCKDNSGVPALYTLDPNGKETLLGSGSSQWTGTSPGPIYYNTGNVGIGTGATSPSDNLQVNGTSGGITINGVGTTNGIDSYTKLMLHLDNNVTDSETSPKTVTNNGPITFSNSIIKSGFGYSGYFPNSTSYSLSVPNSSDFNFSGDFTVDFLWYPITLPSGVAVIGNADNAAGTSGWSIFYSGTTLNAQAMYSAGSWAISIGAASTLNLNAWNHVALIRHGSTVNLYVNGSSIASGTYSGSITTTNNLIIGKNEGTSAYPVNGYLDEVRISNGIARWTSNFTPPTSPYSGTTTMPSLTLSSNGTTVSQISNSSTTGNLNLINNGNSAITVNSSGVPSFPKVNVNGGVYYNNSSNNLANSTNLLFDGTNMTLAAGWMLASEVDVGNGGIYGASGDANAYIDPYGNTLINDLNVGTTGSLGDHSNANLYIDALGNINLNNTVDFNTPGTNVNLFNDGTVSAFVGMSQANPGGQLTAYNTSSNVSSYISVNASYMSGAVRQGLNGTTYSAFNLDNSGNVQFAGGSTVANSLGVNGTGGQGTGNEYMTDANGLGGHTDGLGNFLFDKNVGIGSASPGQKLDVVGNVRATSFIGNGSALTGISSSQLWVTGNVGINTTNNVGIGSTSPGSLLDIQGTLRALGTNGSLSVGTANPAGYLDIEGTLRPVVFGGISAGSTFKNVGIGSFSPGQLLDVQGTARFFGSGNSAVQVTNGATFEGSAVVINNTNGGQIGVGSTANWFSADDVSTKVLNGGGLTRFTVINSSGNVGIGSATPGQLLDVNGTIRELAGQLLTIPATASTSSTTGDIVDSGGLGVSGSTFMGTATNALCGGTTPILCSGSNGTNGLVILNSSLPSSTSGGGIIAVSNNNNVNGIVNGNRLGFYLFSGYNTVSVGNAAGVQGWGEGTWSSTSQPSYLTFETTPVNSITRVQAMEIDSTGNVGIGSVNPGQALDVQGTIRGLSGGSCTTLYQCVGGVDAGVVQTSACTLCPASTCTAMHGCF